MSADDNTAATRNIVLNSSDADRALLRADPISGASKNRIASGSPDPGRMTFPRSSYDTAEDILIGVKTANDEVR
jgi:hypothetical protein